MQNSYTVTWMKFVSLAIAIFCVGLFVKESLGIGNACATPMLDGELCCGTSAAAYLNPWYRLFKTFLIAAMLSPISFMPWISQKLTYLGRARLAAWRSFK